MKIKSPVAKNLHKFNKPCIIPSNKRKELDKRLGSRVIWEEGLNACEDGFTQGEGDIQLMFEED